MTNNLATRVFAWRIENAEYSLQGRLKAPRKLRLGELGLLSQSLAEHFVKLMIRNCRQARSKISCAKGCGACCRYVVPLSPPEAWMILDRLAALPPEESSIVHGRFQRAQQFLLDQGLAESSLLSLGADYFSRWIACPFLQDECCSIHADRPSACREHLVTSPARLCEDVHANSIQCITPPVRLAECLSAVTANLLGGGPVMVPLVRVLDWAAQNEAEGRREWDSAYLIENLIHALGGKVSITSCS